MRPLYTLLVVCTLAFPIWIGTRMLPVLAQTQPQPVAEQFTQLVHLGAAAQAGQVQTPRIPKRTDEVFAPPALQPYVTPTPQPPTTAKAARVAVAVPDAAVRTDPASGPVAFVPAEGDVLAVRARAEAAGQEWLLVRAADGQQGWVSGRIVRAVPDA